MEDDGLSREGSRATVPSAVFLPGFLEAACWAQVGSSPSFGVLGLRQYPRNTGLTGKNVVIDVQLPVNLTH